MREALVNYFGRIQFQISDLHSTLKKRTEAMLSLQSTVFPIKVDFLFVVMCSAVLSLVASHLPAHGLLLIGSQWILVEEIKIRAYRTLSKKAKPIHSSLAQSGF